MTRKVVWFCLLVKAIFELFGPREEVRKGSHYMIFPFSFYFVQFQLFFHNELNASSLLLCIGKIIWWVSIL